MKNFLVVVDMQNDFITGALGTAEAEAIVNKAKKKIENFDGDIFVTYDTHFENYMETSEGKNLPVYHCIKGTEGWMLNKDIETVLQNKNYIKIEKITFGSVDLPKRIKEIAGDEKFSVELIGLCTDICVVSNAVILKANFPETEIIVDASCCAGVSVNTHKEALDIMKCCQIKVIND